jgi:hypothetical protein
MTRPEVKDRTGLPDPGFRKRFGRASGRLTMTRRNSGPARLRWKTRPRRNCLKIEIKDYNKRLLTNIGFWIF